MIERLYIHNFRCFENFTIDLIGRPSALIIGNNGCGKSTLRQALEVFQKICRGPNRVKNWIVASDFTQGRTHVPIRMEADVALAGSRFKYAVSFEWPEDAREARIIEESLEVDGTALFTRQRADVSQSGGPTFGLDWHLAALPAFNYKDRAYDGLNRRIKSFFASMVLIAPVPSEMSGFSEEETVELQPDASNFSAWLNALLLRHPAAYNDIFTYLKYVFHDLDSFENIRRGESGRQLLVRFQNGKPDNSLLVEFKHLSDGEKCFFLSALIVAANRVSGPVFCMWDEPDNHLSLSEIGHFVTGLRKMTNQKGQFVATSHHPETIRRFSGENTIVFTRKSHLEPSVAKPLSEIQYGGDLIEAMIRNEVIG